MTTFILKNLLQLFDKYAVAHTENDALVKNTRKIFSNFVAFSENPNFKTETKHAIKKISVFVTLVLVHLKLTNNRAASMSYDQNGENIC